MAKSFQFGVYAGSVSGTPQGMAVGPQDDVAEIAKALDELQQGNDRSLVVRAYLHYRGAKALDQDLRGGEDIFSQRFAEVLSQRRKLDLVLYFHDPGGDVEGWKRAIAKAIEQYRSHLTRLQITEEANLKFGTGSIDGDYPNVVQALVEGIVFARAELNRIGLSDVPVGFSVAPALFGPAKNSFWGDLKDAATPEFVQALGYVGADFFPDVFYPTALGDIPKSVAFLLKHFRDTMTDVGIPEQTSLIVTENGWPTGPARSEEKQAQVMRAVVESVYANREQFNVCGYTWFTLRDADSANEDLFYQFGLLRSDYARKQAFVVFREMMSQLR